MFVSAGGRWSAAASPARGRLSERVPNSSPKWCWSTSGCQSRCSRCARPHRWHWDHAQRAPRWSSSASSSHRLRHPAPCGKSSDALPGQLPPSAGRSTDAGHPGPVFGWSTPGPPPRAAAWGAAPGFLQQSPRAAAPSSQAPNRARSAARRLTKPANTRPPPRVQSMSCCWAPAQSSASSLRLSVLVCSRPTPRL